MHYSWMEDTAPFDSFLQSLAPDSKVKYQARVNQFLSYCESNELEVAPPSVQSFLVELHEKYMTSTLWSIFAMLKAYFTNQHQLDLKTLLPGVPRLLKNWEKQEEKNQSKVNSHTFSPKSLYIQIFSKDQLEKFLDEAPNDADWIHCKVTVAVACYGLLRLAEIENLQRYISKLSCFHHDKSEKTTRRFS